MSNKFIFLTKESLRRKIKNKTFYIVNIILLIVIVCLCNIDNIINSFGGDFNKENRIIVVDKINYYDYFKESFKSNVDIFSGVKKIKYKMNKISGEDEGLKQIKSDNDILVELYENNNKMNAKITSKGYIDKSVYELINTSINNANKSYVLEKNNISKKVLDEVNERVIIKRVFLDKTKDENEENNEFIMNILYPIVILPIFMLILLVIQMIGAEINEEKSTKSMEIIISNVSAKVHFFSKIVSANLFVFIQSILLIIYSFIGIKIRGTNLDISSYNISSEVVNSSSIIDKLMEVLPLIIVMMVLTIICYSILAGILASVTTNMEDFQQTQTPIIIISLIGFYASFMNSIFEGALFLRILSYIPFISAILSPCLYLSGVIGIKDLFLSILLMVLTLYLLIKYGFKIYREGLLNYSSNNLWKKIFNALKD